MKTNKDNFIPRDEALALLLNKWHPSPSTEMIHIEEALGRVTSEDIFSQNSLPVCRSSQVDGIAVRSADFVSDMPDTKNWVRGKDFVRADTGDDFDDRFDTVIRIEDISWGSNGQLNINDKACVKKGNLIKQCGSMVKENDLLVAAQTRLTPIHLSVLAAGGIEMIPVYAKPRVVYIPTGNELIPIGEKPKRGQNIETNGIMISNFLKQWGAEPINYPIVKDKIADLTTILEKAVQEADIVLINGGSSKGEEDYSVRLMRENGALLQHGIRAIPGKPVALGMLDNTPIINLPGPPLGTFYAMDWFVSALVHAFLKQPQPIRPKIKVTLCDTIIKPADYVDFEMFSRLVAKKSDTGYKASLLTWENNMPTMMTKCNSLLIVPAGITGYNAGDEKEVELLYGEEYIE